MDERDFESARQRLETLLNREIAPTEEACKEEVRLYRKFRVEDLMQFDPPQGRIDVWTLERADEELRKEGALVYMRSDQSYFVGAGSHQAVIDLGSSLVAKSWFRSHPKWVSATEWNKYSTIHPFSKSKYFQMSETVDTLRELGFAIPEVRFYRIFWDQDRLKVSPDVHLTSHEELQEDLRSYRKDGTFTVPRNRLPNVYVTVDLSESGQYSVVDYDESVVLKLPNGSCLKREFEEGCELLSRLYKNYKEKTSRGPYLTFQPHQKDTLQEAIEHAFLLQVPTDKNKQGKLVLADFDHIYAWK